MYRAPDSWKGLYDSTLREAKAGTIGAARLDDAVRRILRVKYKLGLFDTDHIDRGDVAAVGAPDHLAIAREAVAKSLVLLKNNDSLMPNRPGAQVLVAGTGADNMARSDERRVGKVGVRTWRFRWWPCHLRNKLLNTWKE